MDPEVSALIAVYQKRLSDQTSQAIALEARVAVLTQMVQKLQQQPTEEPVAEPAPKKRTRKSVEATDAGSF